MEKYINNNIVANKNDTLSLEELNCLYRPIAIACDVLKKGNYHVFTMLISFIHSFFLDERFRVLSYTKNHPVFSVFDDYLGDVLNVKINRISFSTKNDMYKRIEQSIQNGVIIFPENVYELYYNPSYKQLHDTHYIIIKGYDCENRIYYILDNMHINHGNSSLYDDFVIKYEDAYEMVKSYCNQFDPDSKDLYFWVISSLDKSNYDPFVEGVKCFYNILGKINLNYTELEMCKQEYDPDTLYEEVKCINLRKLFWKSCIAIILKISVEDNDSSTLIREIKSVIKSIDLLKNKLIYAVSKNRTDKKISDFVNKNIDTSNKVLNEIKKYLERHFLKSLVNSKSIKTRNSNYEIRNEKGALYEIHNKEVTVVHNNATIYDTWTLVDNSWQMYFNKHINTLEVKIYATAKVFQQFHFGIIIKEGANTILFGLESGAWISVYNPNDKHDFTLCKRDCMTNNLYIKAESTTNKINLYYKRRKEEDYFLLYKLKVNETVSKIGLFSKTWEEINNKVIFSDIRLNESKESYVFN